MTYFDIFFYKKKKIAKIKKLLRDPDISFELRMGCLLNLERLIGFKKTSVYEESLREQEQKRVQHD